MDFATAKSTLIELLQKNPIYANYRLDAEGNNITILIELIAYLNQLTTYYTNMLAKNQYLSTSELFETTHMLAGHSGYNPQGYRSSQGVVTVTIDTSAAGLEVNDVITIPSWKKMYCTELSHPITGEVIQFANTITETSTVATTASALTMSVSAREGVITSLTYHGSDIENDYRLYLPMQPYDYGDDIDNGVPCMVLFVNGTPWTRLSDFYESSSGLTENNNVFMMKIDKYKRYFIEFSSSRNVPNNQDEILIGLLKTSGIYGNVPSGSIINSESQFVYNVTDSAWVSNNYVSLSNSVATIGGAGVETVEEIKQSAIGSYHSQFRNVNKDDYISHLESRADVVKATVWGEQDISPSGSTADYNRVYMSLIPSIWDASTISSTTTSAGLIVPSAYNTTWKNVIMEYLEPRKIITTYEEFVLPDLIYFSFIVGLKIRTNYTFAAVQADVVAKLTYYMLSSRRYFHDIISHTDIIDFMMDTTIESDSDDFDCVKGLQTFTVRDIIRDNGAINAYGSATFPYYMTALEATYDNQIRRIQLGYNQFPMLNTLTCIQEY